VATILSAAERRELEGLASAPEDPAGTGRVWIQVTGGEGAVEADDGVPVWFNSTYLVDPRQSCTKC